MTGITFLNYLAVSCPPGWMTKDGLCYLNKGASLTFQEAEEYCEVTILFHHLISFWLSRKSISAQRCCGKMEIINVKLF